jgi:hypothetical protein
MIQTSMIVEKSQHEKTWSFRAYVLLHDGQLFEHLLDACKQKMETVIFESLKRCSGKDYMCHPTIKTFLDKTSLDLLVSDKRRLVDYG